MGAQRYVRYESARMSHRNRKKPPRCIVIAGPNGPGKSTFVRRYLPHYAGVVHFVNGIPSPAACRR